MTQPKRLESFFFKFHQRKKNIRKEIELTQF